MNVPISWLKEFVDIKLPLQQLMWKLTEIGLTTEKYEKKDGDVVLDCEVTPNRPDWLSILGVAREVAVFENNKIRLPDMPEILKPKSELKINVDLKASLSGRYTGIAIANVKAKPSPSWMQKRLILMGLRPINNLVDITNYVMYELGVPLHVFDYDKFLSHKLVMKLADGGENFVSVDGISYTLPKGTLVIEDKNRIIDLCGIKGGENTGITESTKNIFIHVPIYDPQIIRKTSQMLKLSSDASYIYERGANAGGTFDTLQRAVGLYLDLAGGEVASDIIDKKSREFEPRKLNLNIDKLNKVLGIEISKAEIISILKRLNLSPEIDNQKIICLIPTYRGDLKSDVDLVEEIARIYGYNKFPKTLPVGSVCETKIPYLYDRNFETEIKNLLVSCGFYEIQSLSLLSGNTIKKSNLQMDNHIKLLNPISLEYEYLRSSLIPNLLAAVKLNSNEVKLKLFEYNKIYNGIPGETSELYKLSGIVKGSSFIKIKGVIDLILSKIGSEEIDIKPTAYNKGLWHPTKSGVIEVGDINLGTFGLLHPAVLHNFEIKGDIYAFEFDVNSLKSQVKSVKFSPVFKYPAQTEDLTIVLNAETKISDIIKVIKKSSEYVSVIDLIDIYKTSFTFRIYYQHPDKTLTDKEVESERTKILKMLKEKFGASLKV